MTGFQDKYVPLTHLPDYMTPFDSEHPLPDREEQFEATDTLRTAIENKVLETIHGLSSAERNAGVYSELALESFDFNGEPIEIEIACADTVAFPNLPQYGVRVLAGPRRLDGTFLNAHDYAIPSGGAATRSDVVLKVSQMPDIPLPAPNDKPLQISPEALGSLIGVLEQAGKDRQTEQDLGLNNQPIGLPEARAIALFISRGNIRPPRINNSKKI